MTRDKVVNRLSAFEPLATNPQRRKLPMKILFILTTAWDNEMNLQFIRRASPQRPQAGFKICGVSDLY